MATKYPTWEHCSRLFLLLLALPPYFSVGVFEAAAFAAAALFSPPLPFLLISSFSSTTTTSCAPTIRPESSSSVL